MKKILLLFSSLGIGSSAILSSTASIKQETNIKNFGNNNNNKRITNINSDENDSINLFITKLTSQNTSKDKGGDGTFYDDEIFLLSLSKPNNSQYNLTDYNTPVKVTSSENNLEKQENNLLANNKISKNDISLDKQEYEKIAKEKDDNGNSRIDITVGLVNRYLSNGLLSYNNNWKISSREDILNGQGEQQSKIIFNKSLTMNDLNSISDYITVGLHLTHVDIVLKAKLINNFILNSLNKGLVYAMDKGLSKLIKEAAQEMGKIISQTIEEFIVQLLSIIGIDLSEMPWIDLVITPLTAIISFALANWIGNRIRDIIVNAVAPGVDSALKKALFKIENEELVNSISPGSIFLGLKFELYYLPWEWKNNKIDFDFEKPQGTILWTVLTPALPDNKLNIGNSLLGTGQNCILYMDADNFKYFINSPDPLDSLKSFDIENKYVTLTNDQWTKITDGIYYNSKYIIPTGDHGVILIIKNGKLSYTNITKDHYNDLTMKDGSLISTFVGTENNSNLFIAPNQIQNLFGIYNYINGKINGKPIWDQIKKDEKPKEDNPIDYFYDKYLSNFLDVSNVDKNTIVNNFKNLENSDLNFINISSNKKITLDIEFNANNINFNN